MRVIPRFVALLIVVGVGSTIPATSQIDDSGQTASPCILGTVLKLTPTPDEVDWHQSAMLQWSAVVPPDCSNVLLKLDGHSVLNTGIRTVVPQRRTTFRLVASERRGTVLSTTEATAVISVRFPELVSIETNTPDDADALIGALEPGPSQSVVVELGCNLDLDMTGKVNVLIASNRNLVAKHGCERSMARPGPRIFVTDERKNLPLFNIIGDNVKVSGFQLQGPTNYMAQGDRVETGITINPQTNPEVEVPLIRYIEVSNMDIFFWSGAGVAVNDSWTTRQRLGLLSNETVGAVSIRDSYLHHNQHGAGFGYGAVISGGGYALIERNVFEENRHGIAGDSKRDKKDADGNVIASVDYSGYTIRHNLILPEGGLHCRDGNEGKWGLGGGAAAGAAIGGIFGGLPGAILGGLIGGAIGGAAGAIAQGICWHTHQIDMHGDGNKFYSDSNWQCGTAGETLMIERNTILYTKGSAIKIRGNPLDKAVVNQNIFKNNRIGTSEYIYLKHPTIDQTGNCDSDEITNPIRVSITNAFDIDTMQQLASCNFGSGGQDQFMATHLTWWAKSAGTGQWYFLNTMPQMVPNLHFADFDGDGICDVAQEINPRQQFYSKSGRTQWILVGSVPVEPPH